jgi:hypothetical protein
MLRSITIQGLSQPVAVQWLAETPEEGKFTGFLQLDYKDLADAATA